MANETITTVVGNLTADPELRFTPSGAAVANFTVASTPRTFDRPVRRVERRGRPVHALHHLARRRRARRRVPDLRGPRGRASAACFSTRGRPEHSSRHRRSRA